MKNQRQRGQFGFVGGIILLSFLILLTLWAYFSSIGDNILKLELASHFQVQYFSLALLILGFLSRLHRPQMFWAGLFLCALLALPIATWYLPPRRFFPTKAAADLHLFIANLHLKNTQYDRVVAMVRAEKPDLAIFMEVDETWQSQLDRLQDILPYRYGRAMPYHLGLLLYTKRPLDRAEVKSFNDDGNVSVIARLTVAKKPITLVATHPPPPIRARSFRSRNRQFERIAETLSGVRNRVILAGDLNTTMWSPYYRRLVRKTGLHNSRKGFGILPTWPQRRLSSPLPAWLIPFLQIPIDHCLMSSGLKTTDIYTGGDTGGDHKPLIVRLRVVP